MKLCSKCHDPAKGAFQKAHGELPGGEQGHLLGLPRPALGRAAQAAPGHGARRPLRLRLLPRAGRPRRSPSRSRRPAGKLCANCHDPAGLAAGGKVEHAPFKKGDCIACHDPHDSNAKKLARAEGNALCTALPQAAWARRSRSPTSP